MLEGIKYVPTFTLHQTDARRGHKLPECPHQKNHHLLKEELWLACINGNCPQVSDKGLQCVQESSVEYFRQVLSICSTLAEHNQRVVVESSDVIQSQIVLYRQREFEVVGSSGLNFINYNDEINEDMSVELYSPSSSSQSSDESDLSMEEFEYSKEEKEEMRIFEEPVIEIETEEDIASIVEKSKTNELHIKPTTISLDSYLHLFRSFSKSAFISLEAFNTLTLEFERQLQLNLSGKDGLFRVMYNGTCVPIAFLMKFTLLEENNESSKLRAQFRDVETECLHSLRQCRLYQRELLNSLQHLINTKSTVKDQSEDPEKGHSSDEYTSPNWKEEDVRSTVLVDFLKEQLRVHMKKVALLQRDMKRVNEVAFSLRNILSNSIMQSQK